MLFDVHQFVIEDLDDIQGKGIWEKIEEEENKPGLRNASGCYIFSIRNGRNFKTWYVGKSEKTRFYAEVFNKNNMIKCKELLKKNGELNLFLLPKLTPTGRFGKPRESRTVQHLEWMLIGYALQQNGDLFNKSHAQMLKQLEVPGLFGDGPGPKPLKVQNFRRTLGL